MKYDVDVFGDSHSVFFKHSQKLKSHAPYLKGISTSIFAYRGASIMGLGKKRSSLNIRNEILEKIGNKPTVLNFGQVDIELGFYYRVVVKGESLLFSQFAEKLSDALIGFVDDLPIDNDKIVIKGVNLTVLKDGSFARKYISKIITENINEADKDLYFERLNLVLGSFRERNSHAVIYNNLLAKKCKNMNLKYFDINHFISDFNPGKGVSDRYIPFKFDHHLVSSLDVHKAHLFSLKEVLDRS